MPADNQALLPIALTLLICDGAHRDPSTGKWTLLGLFNSIHARDFPITHPQLIAYLALTEARGTVPIRFQIVDTDESESLLFHVDTELKVNDPRVVADVVIPIRDVKFPQAGEYRLQVYACNQFLIERRISVQSAT
jgi:hypothetical protein